ncbi:HCL584Cp [Eremothecium sinecaudum]|uniref:HCL584Cp n=1 Tax=Eremothecium sinecaudum TaxID=45286 RepID=A0A109UYN3_9SACH|nr:HCL584Cp [Eremothecium sinecaudum]AMD19567.1 HCL584Cp [Eremothecium sinecaudum]
MIKLEDLRTLNPPDHIEVPDDETTLTEIATVLSQLQSSNTDLSELKEKDNKSFLDSNDNFNAFFEYSVAELLNKRKIQQEENEPHHFKFSSYTDNMQPRDLEIIKTTALFCVVNEENNYVSAMREKYSDNPIFRFLNPSNSLNSVFTSFINQYKQIKSKEYGILSELQKDYRHKILKRAFNRACYNEKSKLLEENEKQVLESMKIRFAAIKWDQYELVETFKITDEDLEDTSIPIAPDFNELTKFSLTNNFKTLFIAPEESNNTKKSKRKNIKVKAAGTTRFKRKVNNNTNVIECPITHRLIPEDQFQKHLNILLTDPNYKTEMDKYKAANNLTNLSTENIHQNIKRLLNIEAPDKKQHI